MNEERTIWILTEGAIGMENQALGIAEGLGGRIEKHVLATPASWKRLPPRLRLAIAGARLPRIEGLAPPWPDVLVTCGGQATGSALAIAKASRGRCFTVHVQRPPFPPNRFDAVIAPAHDTVQGGNVFMTQGAVHAVTREKLAAAAPRMAARYAHLPRPYVAVLIGGGNNRYHLTTAAMREFAAALAGVARAGHSLLVTPSRRTGEDHARLLAETLAGLRADVWDGTGENPYLGMLALADAIVVTKDSVSMTSEAAFTGKPVHVVELDGRSRRIDSFHDRFRAAGYTRPFRGGIEHWTYAPPDDTAAAVRFVRERMAARPRRARRDA
jgi:hypothetical protein